MLGETEIVALASNRAGARRDPGWSAFRFPLGPVCRRYGAIEDRGDRVAAARSLSGTEGQEAAPPLRATPAGSSSVRNAG